MVDSTNTDKFGKQPKTQVGKAPAIQRRLSFLGVGLATSDTQRGRAKYVFALALDDGACTGRKEEKS